MGRDAGVSLVVGLDFGTDSCRAVLVDASPVRQETPETGPDRFRSRELFSAVAAYPRWKRGEFCEPAASRYRQHPLDYLASMREVFNLLYSECGPDGMASVRGIAIDTTASTPCAVDASGVPLSMHDDFASDPDAMFILWKDHTATEEARLITDTARTWGGEDFTRYEGGVYSAEWFWAKALHILRTNRHVASRAASFVEHADWMSALLTGVTSIRDIRRSRCAMGHKALWHGSFGGYPSEEFMRLLHPDLPGIAASLGSSTFTSDTVAGYLTGEWAAALHLPPGIPVMAGSVDAHVGAVGGGVADGVLVKVMGTSTCDMIVAPRTEGDERIVQGICGQVDGSIVPGWTGYEAGQSAFGDVYAWLRDLLLWPIDHCQGVRDGMDDRAWSLVRQTVESNLIDVLSGEAQAIDPLKSGIVALDWLNGRRTPDADQGLKAAITGLTLATTPPMLFRALVEATAYGSRAIVERFAEEGLQIRRIVAVGGVARRSPFVVQTVADVLGMPVDVLASEQTVALGAAMMAAVGAGIYSSVQAAQSAMQPPVERTFTPDLGRTSVYNDLYRSYRRLGAFVEGETSGSSV